MLFMAVTTNPPHQPLGDDGAQGTGHQIARSPHIHQSQGAGDRIIGVQGRQHQVTGHGAAQADFDRLLIAHLPHQQDVRVLPQGGPQYGGKIQTDLRVDLNLVDARQAVLHRVFDRDHLVSGLIQLGEGSVQGGGLAAPGGTGDHYHAVRAPQLTTETLQQQLRHPGVVQRQQARRLIQQTHDHGFAVLHRHGRHPHVDLMTPDPHVEPAILRQPLLGDVETRQQLQAQHQSRRDPHLVEHVLMQHAVDPLPNAQHLLIGLDVDIRGVHLHRIFKHRAQQLDHRRLALAGAGIGQPEIKTGLLILLLQLFGETLDLLGSTIELIEVLQQLSLARHRQLQLAGSDQGSQGIQGRQIRRIRHDHRHLIPTLVHRQRSVTTGMHLGDQLHRLHLDRQLGEVEERDVQLLRQKFQQLLLTDEAQIHQRGSQLAARLPLLLQCQLQLIVGDDAFGHQQVAESHFESGLRHGSYSSCPIRCCTNCREAGLSGRVSALR